MKRTLAGFLIVAMLAVSIPTKPVQAAGGGIGGIVFDPTNLAEAVVTNTIIGSLVTKEYVLDGIAFAVARLLIQSMVQSILTWINSGFQGSPAFITDLQAYLRSVADQVVSDFIQGSELAFLCDPFKLDVRIAVATQYNTAQRDGYQAQCTFDDIENNIQGFLQGDFTQGGWTNWFHLTQGATNDPNRAYFEASMQLDASIRNAQGEEVQLLEFGDGFLSFRVCSDTQAQSGAVQNCTITTPGRVIADQVNSALNVGRDQLITADEINEIIGALLAQLAQQALTGTFGLLGLGGNSGYTQFAYGSDGASSYLDALAAEEVPLATDTPGAVGTSFTFTSAADSVDRFLVTQTDAAAKAGDAILDYDERVDSLEAAGCTVPNLPSRITDAETEAVDNILLYESVQLVIEELLERFQVSTDPAEQTELLAQIDELKSAGVIPTQIEITEAEITNRFDLEEAIAELDKDLEEAEADCP
jgi:hypothetical protein